MAAFGCIIRFKDDSGDVHYGELDADRKITKDTWQGLSIPIYNGQHPWDDDFALTSEKRIVREVRRLKDARRRGLAHPTDLRCVQVLCPLENSPTFMCVGLNYRHHADEAGVRRHLRRSWRLKC